MKMIAKSPLEELLSIEASDDYDLDSELFERQIIVGNDESSRIRYFHTTGLMVADALAKCEKTISNTLIFDGDIVLMAFHLEGDTHINRTGENARAGAVLREPGHNIEVTGGAEFQISFEGGSPVDSFVIVLSRDFCLRIIPKEQDYYHLIRAIEEGRNAKLSRKYLPLNQEIKRIIGNIRNCRRTGSFHRLCLELKIAELLLLQLEQYRLLNSNRKIRPEFTGSDLARLEAARKILEESFSNPPTIRDLSLRIGVNESKLKSDFKKLFDRTIHSYILKLRMQEAYRLITGEGLLLKEVAMRVGYRNPSHFSAAFREFYGVCPRQLTPKAIPGARQSSHTLPVS